MKIPARHLRYSHLLSWVVFSSVPAELLAEQHERDHSVHVSRSPGFISDRERNRDDKDDFLYHQRDYIRVDATARHTAFEHDQTEYQVPGDNRVSVDHRGLASASSTTRHSTHDPEVGVDVKNHQEVEGALPVVQHEDNKKNLPPLYQRSVRGDLELHWAIVYEALGPTLKTAIAIFLAGILASASGIGGGGIFVVILMLSNDLSPHQAVPLSKAIIFGGAVKILLMNIAANHDAIRAVGGGVADDHNENGAGAGSESDSSSRVSRTSAASTKMNKMKTATVEPDLALMRAVVPQALAGTVFGVLFNAIFPPTVLVTCLAFLLTFMATKTTSQGIQKWKESSATSSSRLALGASISNPSAERQLLVENQEEEAASVISRQAGHHGGAGGNPLLLTASIPTTASINASYNRINEQDSTAGSASENNIKAPSAKSVEMQDLTQQPPHVSASSNTMTRRPSLGEEELEIPDRQMKAIVRDLQRIDAGLLCGLLISAILGGYATHNTTHGSFAWWLCIIFPCSACALATGWFYRRINQGPSPLLVMFFRVYLTVARGKMRLQRKSFLDSSSRGANSDSESTPLSGLRNLNSSTLHDQEMQDRQHLQSLNNATASTLAQSSRRSTTSTTRTTPSCSSWSSSLLSRVSPTALASQISSRPELQMPPLVFPFVATFAGVCSGLFGIGGGLIFSPFFLYMQVDPTIAVATSASCVIFTSTSTTFQYLLLRRIIVPYAFLYGTISFLSAIVGLRFIQDVRKRFGERGNAITILVVAFAVGLSAVAAIVKLGKTQYEHH
ncbi:unnamed protein product [Amoebophrya sp. A25]|nr:unnamed protein product [Amoebophrya sp. A25]|eukprot:GSA25T00004683001.1